MNIRSTYGDPDYRRALDNLLTSAMSGDPDEYAEMKQLLSAAKGNVTRRNRLEMGGVDTDELLRPADESNEPGGLASLMNEIKPYGRKAMSTLGAILKAADTGRNLVAKNILGPLLGLDDKLGDKEEVTSSDILGAMGMEEGKLRGALGFAADIATDPLTYLTGGAASGARVVGGKALSMAGKKFGMDIAERLAKTASRGTIPRVGEKAFLKNIPRTGLKEVTPEIEDIAFKRMAKMIESGDPQITSNMFDKGGLKWMGQSIIPSSTMKVIGEKSKATVDLLAKVPIVGKVYEGLKPIAHRLGRAFIPDYGLPEAYKPIKEWAANTQVYREGEVLDRTAEIFREVPSKYFSDPNVQTLPVLAEMLGGGFGVKRAQRMFGRSDRLIQQELGIPDVDWLPVKKAAENMNTDWQKMGEKLKGEGVLNNFIDYYTAHLYELKKKLPYNRRAQINSYNAIVQNLKKDRVFNTVDDAIDYIDSHGFDDLIRVMAPGEAYALKMLSANKALTEKQFLDKIVSTMGQAKGKTNYWKASRNLEKPENMVWEKTSAGQFNKIRMADEGLVPLTHNGKEYWIPAEVDNDLFQMKNSGVIGQAEMSDLLKTFDSWQNWFKKYVTIPFPSFHVRNLYSDMFRAGLRSVTGLANPKILQTSTRLMTGKPDKLAGKFFTTKAGTQVSYEQIYKQFRMNGLQRHEIGRADLQNDILKVVGHKDKKKLLTGYMDMVQKYGVMSENHTKMVHFLMNLDDGLDFAQAAKATKKFHYDYGALTQFEKQFMRRLIPFYPWLRKNTAFMLRSFYERPGKQLATIRLEEYGLGEMLGKGYTEEEREALPEFMREQISVPLFGTVAGDMNVLTNIDLPIDELNELGIGLSGWRALAKSLGGRMSPAVKYPLELLSGRDFYFGTPLDEKSVNLETGETKYPYNKAYDYMAKIPGLRELLDVKEVETSGGDVKYTLDPKRRKVLEMILGGGTGSRMMSEANKIEQLISGSSDEKKAALLNLLTGAKVYPIDMKKQQLRDLTGKIRQKQFLLSKPQ